jgi:dTDP-4-dehydrorhamnose reductase
VKNNNKILIVGKKSFLGQNIYNYFKKKKIKVILKSFEHAMSTNLNYYDFIINTSINKKYFFYKYNKIYDCDLILAKKIRYSRVRYVFFSSRKVYKNKINILEDDYLYPQCNYSRNKLQTENILLKILKSRVLILRISNILGLKKNFKKTRTIHTLFIDNFFFYQLRNSKILFKNCFKDFITIDQFCRVIYLLIKLNATGIFNVSLGKKIFLSEIILWLKKINKKIFIKKQLDIKSSFTLNNKKLLSKIKIRLLKRDVKSYCLNLYKKI